ncbi:hypothetical protein ZWY2020_037059 [Hordeum vulgare]|nr:hypothetical protein ZWY2020_037059 [Hordeum vulgare]
MPTGRRPADLLAPEEISKVALEERQKKPLPLMEDGKGGVLVRGLEEEIVTNCGEIFSLLERGSAKRRCRDSFEQTIKPLLFAFLNHNSHKEATPEGEELIKCGKLNLVDLAGSENICRSGAGRNNPSLRNRGFWQISPVWCPNTLLNKRELVDVRLNSLGDAARGNKTFLGEHTSAMEGVTKDAKRKWENVAEQAENDCKVGSSFSSAKHCRMETIMREWSGRAASRAVVLLHDLEEDGVDDDVAVDADGEAARPEQHGRFARDLHDGVSSMCRRVASREDSAGVVGELHGVEPGREVEQAARRGGLLAGVEARGAEACPVEDGDVGGAVAHRHHVGVGGVDGEVRPMSSAAGSGSGRWTGSWR